MGRREEIDEEIARLTAERDAPDDTEEVWVEQNGARTKLTGQRARNWLKRHGYDDDSDDQGDGKAGGKGTGKAGDKGDKDGDGAADQDGTPPAGHGYFRGRNKG